MPAILQNIYRYPVKSMGGQSLTNAALALKGIPGDRSWAVKDEAKRSIRNGKFAPELMNCTTRLLGEPSAAEPSPPVEICCPDGSPSGTTVEARMRASNDLAGAALSKLLGSPVSLWPLMPEDQLEHYQRAPPDSTTDPEAALRAVFARTPDEPLPDLSQFPAELFEYESPPGTYFDAYPLLLLSTNAVAAMQRAAPESQIDVRRFRPNLLFDVDFDAGVAQQRFPEDRWAGKTLRIGSVTLKVELPCPRCIMTTHSFAELPRDPTIMRALVRENGGNLGVYASVLEPGTVAVGDQLEIV
jgi:uncharacterized protein YcbX